METNFGASEVARTVGVMIRGIPKEGWKPSAPAGAASAPAGVMIRGIPKEGWKRGDRGCIWGTW